MAIEAADVSGNLDHRSRAPQSVRPGMSEAEIEAEDALERHGKKEAIWLRRVARDDNFTFHLLIRILLFILE